MAHTWHGAFDISILCKSFSALRMVEDEQKTFPESAADLEPSQSIAAPTQSNTPQKSPFMQLPAELRLRIYEFAFAPQSRSRNEIKSHCCTNNGIKDTYNSDPSCGLVCTCWGPIETSLLRVNRKMYQEALPVLYNITQIRLVMPVWPSANEQEPAEDILTQIMRVPHQGLEQIRNSLIVCGTTDICIFAPLLVSRFFDKIRTHLPGVRHIRLNYDLSKRFNFRDPQSDGLAGVIGGAALKTVQIEATGCCWEFGDLAGWNVSSDIRKLRHRLVNTITSRAVGTNVRIIDDTAVLEERARKVLEPIEDRLTSIAGRINIDPDLHIRNEVVLLAGKQIKAKALVEEDEREAFEQEMWEYVRNEYIPDSRALQQCMVNRRIEVIYKSLLKREEEGAAILRSCGSSKSAWRGWR